MFVQFPVEALRFIQVWAKIRDQGWERERRENPTKECHSNTQATHKMPPCITSYCHFKSQLTEKLDISTNAAMRTDATSTQLYFLAIFIHSGKIEKGF